MHITNISEAKSSLSSLIAQVEKGHKIIIGKAGKPVAMLVPYRADTTPRKLGGTWTGKVKMADDFDTLPPELAEVFYGKSTP
jgi:prevent-host-death family protein